MIKMQIDQVIKKINEATGLSEGEIKDKIANKLKLLDGLVSEEGAAYIIASELGVKLFKDATSGEAVKINKILPGMRSVEVVGKITRLFDPITFERQGKQGRVGSLILGDETGSIRVAIWDERVDWFDDKLKQDVVIRIKDAYSKENNRGGTELHLARRSQLIIEENMKINVATSAKPATEYGGATSYTKIAQLQPNQFQRTIGTVVQLFNPFFYPVCPTCGKKVVNADTSATCSEHGQIEAKPAMVFSFIIDDGRDMIRCVAFRDRAEQLVGSSAEDAKELIESDQEIMLREQIEGNLLARMIEIEGRVNLNDAFERKELLVNKINLTPDAKLVAERMLRGE